MHASTVYGIVILSVRLPVCYTPVLCRNDETYHIFHRLLALSLQFLPRDAMHKRGLCRHAVSVCLSVCVSVCLSRS